MGLPADRPHGAQSAPAVILTTRRRKLSQTQSMRREMAPGVERDGAVLASLVMRLQRLLLTLYPRYLDA